MRMDILREMRAAMSRSQGSTHGGGPSSDKPSGPPPKSRLPSEIGSVGIFPI